MQKIYGTLVIEKETGLNQGMSWVIYKKNDNIMVTQYDDLSGLPCGSYKSKQEINKLVEDLPKQCAEFDPFRIRLQVLVKNQRANFNNHEVTINNGLNDDKINSKFANEKAVKLHHKNDTIHNLINAKKVKFNDNDAALELMSMFNDDKVLILMNEFINLLSRATETEYEKISKVDFEKAKKAIPVMIEEGSDHNLSSLSSQDYFVQPEEKTTNFSFQAYVNNRRKSFDFLGK